jgi:hypothetical protein
MMNGLTAMVRRLAIVMSGNSQNKNSKKKKEILQTQKRKSNFLKNKIASAKKNLRSRMIKMISASFSEMEKN